MMAGGVLATAKCANFTQFRSPGLRPQVFSHSWHSLKKGGQLLSALTFNISPFPSLPSIQVKPLPQTRVHTPTHSFYYSSSGSGKGLEGLLVPAPASGNTGRPHRKEESQCQWGVQGLSSPGGLCSHLITGPESSPQC